MAVVKKIIRIRHVRAENYKKHHVFQKSLSLPDVLASKSDNPLFLQIFNPKNPVNLDI